MAATTPVRAVDTLRSAALLCLIMFAPPIASLLPDTPMDAHRAVLTVAWLANVTYTDTYTDECLNDFMGKIPFPL